MPSSPGKGCSFVPPAVPRAERRNLLWQIAHSARPKWLGLHRLLQDTHGTTAIEYALIASLVAVVIVGAVELVGNEVLLMFTSVANAFP